MFLTPTDTKEVKELINDLSVNKAKDIYGISVNFVKILANDISPSLCHIFNESFFTGIFPDLLKFAMITPTYKGGSRLETSTYRPVSVLPIFSKILEKLMQRRLTKFLDENKIIYEHQFGFQKNKSTTLAVLDLYSQILQTLEKKKIACSVFLDFAKAFDTVDHEILTKKLEHYGIRGVVNEWFDLYLSNRFQTVKINGKLSNKELITCGVPQGGILGPVLFLIYINDIKNSSNILNFFLFADDTSTYLTGNNAKEIKATYNCELKKVLCWLNANKLSLNTDKSNLVLFRGPRKKMQYNINVQINGKQIKEK